MVSSPLLIAALLPLAVRAANDWSKPCFGQCSWDINSGTGSGTVQIAGTQSGISDLTTAAGWEILDCDANTADQDIRLVCSDPSKGCDHVNQDGAAGTIVRLPTSCGSMPFALVTRQWVHSNQKIPASKRSLLTRRKSTARKVMGTTLSTTFEHADPAKTGNVTIFIQGSSLPGAADNFTHTPPTDGQQLSKRGLFSWIGKTLSGLNDIHKTLNGSTPINFEGDVPLFNTSIDCPQSGSIPGFSGSVGVDLNGKVDGTVNFGVAAAGTLVPPKLEEFGLFVGLDATVVGTLGVDATLTGSISTGKIPLFQTGIPGLDFPGLLSIGPTFSVNAEADATLDANLNMDVDIDYTISGAELFFPPQDNSGGSFTPGDSNIQLSVSPDVQSNGQVDAHIIPTLSFGVNALSGLAKATISLDVDGQAGLDLSLSGSASASKGTNSSAAVDKTFGGCVDITTGLTVSAGADASLLGLFDKSTSVNLFQKTFDLFKKCFGDSAARRAYTGRKAREALLAKRAAIACPTTLLGDAVSIATESITGSSLV